MLPATDVSWQERRLRKKEAGRERKALRAAQLERGIERELLARLHAGTYGDIYNFPSLQYRAALRSANAGEQTSATQTERESESVAAKVGTEAPATTGKRARAGSLDNEDVDDEQDYEVEAEAELDYASDDVRFCFHLPTFNLQTDS